MAYPNARGWDDSGNDVHVRLRPGDTYRHGGIEYAHDGLPIHNTRDEDSENRSHTRLEARGSTSRPSEAPRRPKSERQATEQALRGLREERFAHLPPRPRYTEEDELREYYAARSARNRAASNTRDRQPFSSPPRDNSVSRGRQPFSFTEWELDILRRRQPSSSPPRRTNVSRRRQPFSSTPQEETWSRRRQPFAYTQWELNILNPFSSPLPPLRSSEDEFDRRFGENYSDTQHLLRHNGPRCCKHGSGYRSGRAIFNSRVPRDAFEERFGTDHDPRVPRDAFDRRFGAGDSPPRRDPRDPCPDPSVHIGRPGKCFARRDAGYHG